LARLRECQNINNPNATNNFRTLYENHTTDKNHKSPSAARLLEILFSRFDRYSRTAEHR
jgi:hypothetical protein